MSVRFAARAGKVDTAEGDDAGSGLITFLVILLIVILVHAFLLGLMLTSAPQSSLPLVDEQNVIRGLLVVETKKVLSPPEAKRKQGKVVKAPKPVRKPAVAKPQRRQKPAEPVRAVLAPKQAPALNNRNADQLTQVRSETVEKNLSENRDLASLQPLSRAKETEQETVIEPRSRARHLKNKAPRYPHLSRRLREEGTVLLDVLILADGSVAQLKMHTSSGYRRLDQAALKAVRQWHYQPATRGGTAIDYWYRQPVVFRLRK